MEALHKTSEPFFTDMGIAPYSGSEDENAPKMGVIISFKTPRFQVKATSLSKKMEGLLRIDQPSPLPISKEKGLSKPNWRKT